MVEFMDLQYREDDLARNRENHGRMAQVFATADTIGSGAIEIPDSVDFSGAIYIEKPNFGYGNETDPEVLRGLLDLGPDEDLGFPQCSAHVTGWDIDENGHYHAAWVALVVTYPDTIGADIQVPVTWHLAFAGVALKDVDPTS